MKSDARAENVSVLMSFTGSENVKSNRTKIINLTLIDLFLFVFFLGSSSDF